jgi:FkbM family methyltransferase
VSGVDVDRLLRRVPRPLQAGIGSVLVSARRREWCLARPAGDGWAHRYRDGVTVHPRLGGASARGQDEAARDMFLHDYEPRPGDVVVDAGAGVGGEVRLLSRLVGPSGRVISVEAHPRTYRYLVDTVRLNRLSNVTTVPVALTGRAGPVRLGNDPGHHIGNAVTTSRTGSVVVAGLTLPEVMARAGVDRVDLLKLNIEGAELDTLRAAGAVLDRIGHVAVSCHDFTATSATDSRRTFAPVRDLLRAAGFTVRCREADARPWVGWYLYARH